MFPMYIWVQLYSSLLGDVSTVGGLHRLPPNGQDLRKASANRKQKRSKAGLHLGVTPSILRARYNLTTADVGTAQNNSQAVAQVWPSHNVSIDVRACQACTRQWPTQPGVLFVLLTELLLCTVPGAVLQPCGPGRVHVHVRQELQASLWGGPGRGHAGSRKGRNRGKSGCGVHHEHRSKHLHVGLHQSRCVCETFCVCVKNFKIKK